MKEIRLLDKHQVRAVRLIRYGNLGTYLTKKLKLGII